MKIDLLNVEAAKVETECLVVVSVEPADSSSNKASLLSSDSAIQAAAAAVIDSGECSGKNLETVLVHAPQGIKAKRLLLVGGGKAAKFSPNEFRNVCGAAVRYLKPRNLRSLTTVLPDEVNGAHFYLAENWLRSAAVGALVGDFDPDFYKSDRKDLSIKEFRLTSTKAVSDTKPLEAALQEGIILGESQNFTRTLVNEPGNRMTPTILARYAREMAEKTGLKCEIYDGDEIQKMKMGAFWSVAQGSDEPPALIVLRYESPDAPKGVKLGLVGKGVTFDTGGISIKPADGMEKMKYDMAGGAAMLGAMRAIALLKPKVNVLGIVCATENMPSGKAQKPGDVQIAMSGKSIEIINTDAEGRLVLADGLAYARQQGCTHLIDAATLTGACVVALGMINAGVFANDEDNYKRFEKAIQYSGEKFWRLPLDDEYREMIRSGIADIVNSGGRWGGAVTAAMFLKEFAEDTPWLHLDIAGVAWMEENKPWIAKGPSGIAVRSIVEWVKGFQA